MALPFQDGFPQFFDNSGDPLSAGLLYTYYAGTTTPLASYTTQAGDVANANPVVLDSAGRANIWLTADLGYRLILKTSAGVTLKDTDNVRLTADGISEFNVKAYGATGDGATSDNTAVQAAVTAINAAGGGTLYFPTGTYVVSSTLAFTVPVTVRGSNCRSAILQSSHTAGPCITFGDYFSGVENLNIQGSAARKAAMNTADVGVKFIKSGSRDLFANFVRKCIINNNGGSGIVSEAAQFLTIEDTRILDNNGHGIVLDATSVSSDSDRSGITGIKNTQIYTTRGHSVLAGLTNYVFRLTMDNVDCGPAALTAAIRQSAYNSHIVGQNVIIRNSAFSGHDESSPHVMTTGGLYINGRAPLIENNRFLDVLTTAVELGADSDGARIIDNQITGTVQTPLNPAYLVASGCTGVYARAGFPANHTTVMTVAPANSGNHSDWYDISPQGLRSALQAVTLADDTIYTWTFTGVTAGLLVLGSNQAAAPPAIVAFRCGDASAYCTLLAGDAADIVVATTTLTDGTGDGTDARLNISAYTVSNSLVIKNRQGGSFSWTPTFLSLSAPVTGGGELVLS